jgi:putative NAD(P)-binding protein
LPLFLTSVALILSHNLSQGCPAALRHMTDTRRGRANILCVRCGLAEITKARGSLLFLPRVLSKMLLGIPSPPYALSLLLFSHAWHRLRHELSRHGGTVVVILRQRDLPVRALVRREDERADALRRIGAEVVVGDLTRAADVARALQGCQRMFFSMSVSAPYLEATVTGAAVARKRGDPTMPPTVIIVSRTMSGRSQDDPRRAPETVSRATPTCLRVLPIERTREIASSDQ